MTNYSRLSDNELAAIMADDSAAFTEIYERHWSAMYRSAYNVLRDENACLDIVQEVFVWFWEHRLTLEMSSVKSYLLVAVKYKVANFIRNSKVRSSFFERLPKVELDDDYPDEALEVKELQEMIKKFVLELPDRCQEVFNLSRNEHLSNREIAEKLGITEKTVENQINTALKRIKGNLGRLAVFIPLL